MGSSGFLPERLRENRQYYQRALEWIEAGMWREAEAELDKIVSPLELAKDAREKLKILKKLPNQTLD